MPLKDKGTANANVPVAIVAEEARQDVRDLIHVVRGVQVMLDSDLARLYQVETRRLNEAVKRNALRFPDSFRFQLTKDEVTNLMSQFATSSWVADGYGGRRKLPYAFTEQGIAMLSAVLRSEQAIRTSIRIMDAFVSMRRFIASNAALFERVGQLELKQLQTDEKIEQVFALLQNPKAVRQKIFFDGQIYDAYTLLVDLIGGAEKDIVLIDGYADKSTLDLLAKKRDGVKVDLITSSRGKLDNADVEHFNAQYPELTVRRTNAFHDRFLILDHKTAYHIGASLKDAGKKCFAVSLLREETIVNNLLETVAKMP